MTKDLIQLRNDIDAIDKRIIDAIADRFVATRAIARYKFEHDLPILNAERETQHLMDLRHYAERLPVPDFLVVEIFENLMKLSREQQQVIITLWKERQHGNRK